MKICITLHVREGQALLQADIPEERRVTWRLEALLVWVGL